eukprot:SAG11_NODE_130_length_15497_cov_10.780556_18_plen_166_part_00
MLRGLTGFRPARSEKLPHRKAVKILPAMNAPPMNPLKRPGSRGSLTIPRSNIMKGRKGNGIMIWTLFAKRPKEIAKIANQGNREPLPDPAMPGRRSGSIRCHIVLLFEIATSGARQLQLVAARRPHAVPVPRYSKYTVNLVVGNFFLLWHGHGCDCLASRRAGPA